MNRMRTTGRKSLTQGGLRNQRKTFTPSQVMKDQEALILQLEIKLTSRRTKNRTGGTLRPNERSNR